MAVLHNIHEQRGDTKSEEQTIELFKGTPKQNKLPKSPAKTKDASLQLKNRKMQSKYRNPD